MASFPQKSNGTATPLVFFHFCLRRLTGLFFRLTVSQLRKKNVGIIRWRRKLQHLQTSSNPLWACQAEELSRVCTWRMAVPDGFFNHPEFVIQLAQWKQWNKRICSILIHIWISYYIICICISIYEFLAQLLVVTPRPEIRSISLLLNTCSYLPHRNIRYNLCTVLHLQYVFNAYGCLRPSPWGATASPALPNSSESLCSCSCWQTVINLSLGRYLSYLLSGCWNLEN